MLIYVIVEQRSSRTKLIELVILVEVFLKLQTDMNVNLHQIINEIGSIHSPNGPILIERYEVHNSKHTLACVSGGGMLTATCLYIKENQLGKVIQCNSQEPSM